MVKRKRTNNASEDGSAKTRRTAVFKPIEKPDVLRLDDFSARQRADVILSCGANDMGQLGYDRSQCTKPRRIDDFPGKGVTIAQVIAGAMHSVALTSNGEVYSWGCDDNGTLGRAVSKDCPAEFPERVPMPSSSKIVQISAGDSHTAALASDGVVYAWGTFRDIGAGRTYLIEHCPAERPVPVLSGKRVVKITSGSDHLVMLTSQGQIYTTGAGHSGQLGRKSIGRYDFRRGKAEPCFMEPGLIRLLSKRSEGKRTFVDVWAFGFGTVAKSDDGTILACGLNNYGQLGIDCEEISACSFPTPADQFIKAKKDWHQFAGYHHTVALDRNGHMFSIGRGDDGRLGTGKSDWSGTLKQISLPNGLRSRWIAVDTASNACVTTAGTILCWGYNSAAQLGQGPVSDDTNERELLVPTPSNSKHLKNPENNTNNEVVSVSLGGQHMLVSAARKKP